MEARSSEVTAALRPWFKWHRRQFSFRSRPTPYKILLAELLLRKTRASDADGVFPAVLALAPTPAALATANIKLLKSLIAPIGLPQRATILVELGRALVERHDGRVPSTRADLVALPGVGPYAAGAVLSIGAGIPSPMVDGPIGRLLQRLGGFRQNGRAPYYDKRVWAFAERLLPATRVREYQLALLDVAALGDRVFLLRQGVEPRGILGSGTVQAPIYPASHWDGSGMITNYCDIEFDAILGLDEVLPIEVLRQRVGRVHWRPQQSGTEVRPPSDRALELLWAEHLTQVGRRHTSSRSRRDLFDKIDKPRGHAQVGRQLGTSYRPAVEDVATQSREPWSVDPDKVDRGLRGHAATQNAAAQFLRELNCEPRSPGAGEPSFDLAWQVGRRIFVAEVKSLTSQNEEQQLRLGLGQVLRYQQVLATSRRDVTPYLVVEREPSDSTWQHLCKSFGVILAWPSRFDAINWGT